ncbi:MAG: SHOCT domain-containing protein [Lacisediminihabitans sp.]
MYWYGNGVDGWGYGLMAIGMLLFWAAVITGIILLVRYLGANSQRHGEIRASGSAENLLAERFARGDIDEEEFTARRAALRRTE